MAVYTDVGDADLEAFLDELGIARLAAVAGVCLFSLLEGEYLTFLWVLAIS